MSLARYFLKDQVIAAEEENVFPLRLDRDDLHHMKVARVAPGEHIAVVDGASDYFECEIMSFDGEVPLVSVSRHLDEPELGAQVLLVQGLAKGEKMDAVIRHTTELGVRAVMPLACERSIVKLDAKKAASRHDRWRAIAKSAAMQSGQPAVPEVLPLTSLSQACEALSSCTGVLVCWEEAPQTARLSEAVSSALSACSSPAADARMAVVVGPEGGLAEREVEALLACNPRSSLVSLGPSILRTETAGIVASALVIYELGGLGA